MTAKNIPLSIIFSQYEHCRHVVRIFIAAAVLPDLHPDWQGCQDSQRL